MEGFWSKFSLSNEKESFEEVYASIEKGVAFRGTNLWILIFAIFVASLGLNVNSTAVIIGAMLISPLMGPIMGIGLGIAVNDSTLLRVAVYNFFVATVVALATSTVFFLISPINDAHSEILARTSPNVYDVLIAVFGGLAGTLATASRNKGNVIPGVAIATALMPPLCTAGYGLATWQMNFFMGAFYLFVINAVFIALGTLLMSRILKFPVNGSEVAGGKRRVRWAVAMVSTITLIPSVYFGYQMIREADFRKKANAFIRAEARFDNNYLLNSQVDAQSRKVKLVFGGRVIRPGEIDSLRVKLSNYELHNADLEVMQGFAYLTERRGGEGEMAGRLLDAQARRLDSLQREIGSMIVTKIDDKQIFRELKTRYPSLAEAVIQPVKPVSESDTAERFILVALKMPKVSAAEQNKLTEFLKARLNENNIRLVISPH